MNLTEALNRRADRGPYRSYEDVITAANAQHTVSPTIEQEKAGPYVHDVPLMPLDRATPPRRPMRVAWAVASVVGIAGVLTLTMYRGRTNDAARSDTPSTVPSPPVELTDRELTQAITYCAAGDSPTASVVDSRPSGILVGQTFGDTWRTCLYPDLARDYGRAIIAGSTTSPAPSARLSLVPDASSQWPIAVIDAKAPEGNDISGDEMTWVWGRVDPSIASVTITTATVRLAATVHDGLFAAVWKGNDGDRAVVRGFDAGGVEIAFSDQLNCAALEPVQTVDGPRTPLTPRLVVHGTYVAGGCVGGADLSPGQVPGT